MYPTLEAKILNNTSSTLQGVPGVNDAKIREYAESNHRETQKRNKPIERQITDAYNYHKQKNPTYSYVKFYEALGKEGVLKEFGRVAPNLYPELVKKYSQSATNVPATTQSSLPAIPITGIKKYLTRSNIIMGAAGIGGLWLAYQMFGGKN